MQERVKDAANLEVLLLQEFIEAEIEKDEVEIEKEEPGWKFYIVRIVVIFILILVIIWGIMKIF